MIHTNITTFSFSSWKQTASSGKNNSLQMEKEILPFFCVIAKMSCDSCDVTKHFDVYTYIQSIELKFQLKTFWLEELKSINVLLCADFSLLVVVQAFLWQAFRYYAMWRPQFDINNNWIHRHTNRRKWMRTNWRFQFNIHWGQENEMFDFIERQIFAHFIFWYLRRCRA